MVNQFTYNNTFRIAEGAFDKVTGAVLTASDWNAKWRLAIKQANYFDATFQQIATLMDAWYAEVTTGLNNAGSMLTTANAALAQANNEYTLATAARAQVAADKAAAEAAKTAADGFRQQASSSAGSANNSATVATQKATAASDSATAAATHAGQAQTHMNNAAASADSAAYQAMNATQAASDAAAAMTAAEAAKTAAQAAQTGTQNDRTTTSQYMQAAQTASNAAATSAGEAELWATNAAASATAAANSVANTADAYIKTTPSAKVYTVNDSANSKLRGITVYGETTQAGTPTPAAQIPLVSASNVGVNVCGKNLIDLSKCYSTSTLATPTYANDVLNVKGKWYALCPVTLAPNTTYYLKTDRRVISSTSTSGDISVYKTATISSPNLIAYFGKINGSFTTTSETLYTILFFSGTDTAGECEFSNVQLELGTTATAYEPYKPAQRVTLNATTTGISGFTLRGIGSVGDTVEVDTKAGTVKLVQRFKEYVATGNEAWNTASGMYYLPYSIALGAMSCYSGGGQLSNWLKLNASGTLGNNEFRISDTLYCKTDFASVDLWKQKLAAEYAAGNPFTVVYQLATPITTDITSSTAGQALLALYSNYPSTTISCDTPVSMTYKADTTNVVDSLATKAELATKADKAQEAWITPTLLNGATGTAYYRKNQFGELALYGTITIGTGSVATILFKMPVNYAPANVALIRAYNNQTGVLLDIAVAVTGDVLLRTTVTTGQSISFSAVIALA